LCQEFRLVKGVFDRVIEGQRVIGEVLNRDLIESQDKIVNSVDWDFIGGWTELLGEVEIFNNEIGSAISLIVRLSHIPEFVIEGEGELASASVAFD